MSQLEPNIQITKVDVNGDRSLTLEYTPHAEIPLANNIDEMLRHIYRLWGFDVKLMEHCDKGQNKLLAQCPQPEIDSP